ncbi:hypothetical protein CHS0354_038356 [Potamilus streckersoni]|uniref:CUB domain-containing protein n=1 Tax=Potamilus streckersoni TaxID=2493646 RepID=A0AAE0S5N7_9BIVA|nr:hypothetical protein CHS0354_038356 [Potamilus streckersoni]
MYGVLAALVICGVGQYPVVLGLVLPSPYVLNSPVYCGQTTQIGDQPVIVKPYREIGDVGNPAMECQLTIESPYQESHYKFSIMVKAATFVDCGMKLYIYNGRGIGSNIRTLGCGTSSASTGTYYSNDAVITLRLTRTSYDYQFGNNFQLEIQLFRDPDAPPDYIGSQKISAGAIVGIVFGILILVAFAILLGWCYKRGKLPCVTKGSTDWGNKHKEPMTTSYSGGFESVNKVYTNGLTSSDFGSVDKLSNTTGASKSNFDVDDPHFWNALTDSNPNAKKDKNNLLRSLSAENVQAKTYFKKDEPRQENNFQRDNVTRLSNSPARSRARTQGHGNQKPPAYSAENLNNRDYENLERGEEGLNGKRYAYNNNLRGRSASQGNKDGEKDKLRPSSGFFENPDAEGYMYDYDHVKTLSSGDVSSEKSPTTPSKKPVDFGAELRDAIRRNSIKRMNKDAQSNDPGGSKESGNQSDSTPTQPPTDEFSKIDFSDIGSKKIEPYEIKSESSIPEKLNEPSSNADKLKKEASNMEKSESDIEVSPKSKKKKSKSQADNKSRKDTKPEPSEQTSKKSKFHFHGMESEPAFPPEAYAPIFATDSSLMEHYYPSRQGQAGYPPGYDPRFPMAGYPPGMHPNMSAYQQAGQAAWFVQATPAGQKLAFAMSTQNSSEPSKDALENRGNQYSNYPYGTPGSDVSHPGMPGYTSTPYYSQHHPGVPHGQKHNKSRSKPHGRGGPDAMNNSSLVPAGTILDDPQVPPPGSSLIRYGEDPQTGMKTSQVIWTDSKPDPTDPIPEPGGPQITRKTITRVTMQSTKDDLPNAPSPNLHQLSFQTAAQLQREGGGDPAFMTPSKGSSGPQAYIPQVMYASETPERTNAPFYTNIGVPRPSQGGYSPVIHEAPRRNQAIRDKIYTSSEA